MSKYFRMLCEEFGVDINNAPSNFDPTNQVDSKLDRAKKVEEFDTITFGLETDDGRVVKVYVKAEQADKFEIALSQELGKQDVIEDVLNKLSKDFDIIDVEWPDSPQDDDESNDELTVDDVDMGDEEDPDKLETDGSESMNTQVWGKPVKDKKHSVKKESDMSYGQLFTKKLLGEAYKRYDSLDTIVDDFTKEMKAMVNDNVDPSTALRDALYDYYSQNGMPYGTQKARDGDPDNYIADHIIDDLTNDGYVDKKTGKWIDTVKEGYSSDLVRGATDDEYDMAKKYATKNLKGMKLDSLGVDKKTGVIYARASGPTGKPKSFNLSKHGELVEAVQTPDEAEDVKQPVGRKYRVGLLDNRFSTQYQFMVYQALLDLGVPDEALFKAPQKNAIVVAIKETAKMLQYDPVRRQALRWLITRLEQVTDVPVVEAKKKEDSMTDQEQKEFDRMKVGILDDRFTNTYQKMLYQTILMLGLPDSFMAKSAFKNVIINSIKEKAKEFMRDSVKRSALRVFTHRFQEKEGKGSKEEVKEATGPRGDMVVKLNKDGTHYVITSVLHPKLKDLQDGGFSNGDMIARKLITGIRNGFGKYNDYTVKVLSGNLNESAGSDTVEFLEYFMDAVTPENKRNALESLKGTSAWQAYSRAVKGNPELGSILASIRSQLSNVGKKLAASGATTPFKEHLTEAKKLKRHDRVRLLDYPEKDKNGYPHVNAYAHVMDINPDGSIVVSNGNMPFIGTLTNVKIAKGKYLKEAKWGGESMLDDPRDKEVDPDTKIKVKLPARKKDVRVGEEAQWEISKNKKSGDLALETNGMRVTLDDESAEKLIKAIANKTIVVLPDSDFNDVKWVFSPRARTYLVKRAGSKTSGKPLILSWEDTNKIEDVYSGK